MTIVMQMRRREKERKNSTSSGVAVAVASAPAVDERVEGSCRTEQHKEEKTTEKEKKIKGKAHVQGEETRLICMHTGLEDLEGTMKRTQETAAERHCAPAKVGQM